MQRFAVRMCPHCIVLLVLQRNVAANVTDQICSSTNSCASKTGRVVTRWQGLDAAKCFDAWRTGAVQQKKILNVCERAIIRMLQELLAKAFQGWQRGAKDQIKFIHVCQKVLTRWRYNRLAKALDGWKVVQEVPYPPRTHSCARMRTHARTKTSTRLIKFMNL